MYDTTQNGRIDPDHYEPSPSTGHAELTRILGATAGADHTPECDAVDCDRDAEPVTVVDDDGPTENVRESVRCSTHAKDFLEVST